MFHFNEKHHTLAIELGISKNTVKKYINELRSLGLISLINGREAIVKLSDCIKVLMGKEHSDYKAFKYVRFKKGVEYSSLTLKEISKKIQIELVRLNISQQNFWNNKILEAKKLLSKNRIKSSEVRRIKAAAKKLGSSNDTSILKRINEGDFKAKTGRNHIAGIIGCSASTGAKRLSKWAKDNVISRTIIRKDLNIVASHAAFDELKDKYSKLLVNKQGSFFVILGSHIEFKNNRN